MQFQHTRYAEAKTHLEQAVRLFGESGDTAGEARAHTGLAAISVETGEWAKAMAYFEAALRLDSDAPGRSSTLFDLGMTQIHLGREADALANLERSRTLALELGLHHLRVRCVGAVAFGDLWAGRLGSAVRGFGEALDGWSELRFKLGITEIVRNLAETCLAAGRPDLASDLGKRTLAWTAEVNTPWLLIGSHVVLGDAALAVDDVETAMRHFTEARVLAPDGTSYWKPSIIRGLAAGHRLSGSLTEALALATEALDEALPRERGRAHAELASVLLAQGDYRGAIEHAGLACEIAEAHSYRLDAARAHQVAAAAHRAAEEPSRARDLEEQAAAIFDTVRAETEIVLVALVDRVPSHDAP
jgi:tetratricopeptide (TPR) repeat protein